MAKKSLVDEAVQKAKNNLINKQAATMSMVSNATVNVVTNAYYNHAVDIQLNAINKQIVRRDGVLDKVAGKGEAAEYANNTFDTLKGRKVSHEGTGFTKNDAHGEGANAVDRTVTNRLTGQSTTIQSKYCKTAKDTYNSFKNGYESVDAFEVPAEQYKEIKQIMKENGDNRVLRKGVSTKFAQGLTKAGTLPSISTDLIDGTIQSSKGASIAFAVTFVQMKFQGIETMEAAKISARAGMITLASGALIYAGGQQFAKMGIAKTFGQYMGKNAAEMAKMGSAIITVTVVFGPTVVDALRGRISVNQMIKSSAVAAGGMGGAMVGASIGSSMAPGIGTLIGGIVGGMAGGKISKFVMDSMLEDDAEEIYQIFKEEIIEAIYVNQLNQEDMQELLAHTVLASHFGSKTIKDIYQKGKVIDGDIQNYCALNNIEYASLVKEDVKDLKAHLRLVNERKYIADEIIGNAIVDIFKKKPHIAASEFEEAENIAREFNNSVFA